MSNMRAKMKVTKAISHDNFDCIVFNAVSKSEGYGDDGLDENNSYATWTPNADLHMDITNPALVGKFAEGQEYYLDFTLVE